MNDLYSEKLLQAAASVPPSSHLTRCDAVTVEKTSKVCGSSVSLDMALDNGKIGEVAVRAKACALGQAAVGLFVPLLIGSDPEDIRQVRDEVSAMLLDDGPVPAGARWESLSVLKAIKDFPQRHASTLLIFEAAVACLDLLDTRLNEDKVLKIKT
ncbi:MAG: iron-sulfur cluster assembly scaffold protein [Pseudomonadota bacterium]